MAIAFIACRSSTSHQDMIVLLKTLNKRNYTINNPFCPEVKFAHIDSLVKKGNGLDYRELATEGSLALKVGQEEKAVNIYEDLIKKMDPLSLDMIMPDIGIAYMRLGERNNCMLNHTGSSCIFPIKDDGVHQIATGSSKAILTYQTILKKHPDDLESKWLLNVAYMTLGKYPQSVPKEFLIPNLDADTAFKVKPFTKAPKEENNGCDIIVA